MPYVMMPVPEEYVEEVMQFILRSIARAAIQPWDAESVSAVFAEVDEVTRSLLAFVARESANGSELDSAQAARKLQLTIRETAGIMNELGTMVRATDRPVLITARTVTDRLPNGRSVEKRMLHMEPEVADLVTAAELADIADAPHPLGEAKQ